jgi:hypothetical protein
VRRERSSREHDRQQRRARSAITLGKPAGLPSARRSRTSLSDHLELDRGLNAQQFAARVNTLATPASPQRRASATNDLARSFTKRTVSIEAATRNAAQGSGIIGRPALTTYPSLPRPMQRDFAPMLWRRCATAGWSSSANPRGHTRRHASNDPVQLASIQARNQHFGQRLSVFRAGGLVQ